MKLLTFLKVCFSITILALVYIHMQMKIIDLAYQGKQKEKVIKKLGEQNNYISQKILTMKSANHLGWKMLSEESKMEFADDNQVVYIQTRRIASKENIKQNEAKQKQAQMISLLPKTVQPVTKP